MANGKIFIVSYDIMNPRRLQRVHKTMKGFGEPIHYSVFRCNLTPKGLVEMKAALFELIKHDQYRIMIIDLGPEDGMVMDRVELIIGAKPRKSEKGAVIF